MHFGLKSDENIDSNDHEVELVVKKLVKFFVKTRLKRIQSKTTRLIKFLDLNGQHSYEVPWSLLKAPQD